MTTYTQAFESAVNHAMFYEVSPGFKLTPDVEKGLIDTTANRKACGYTNDPKDKGGETKFGIAKVPNPTVDVTNLTWEQAKEIYYKSYWLAGHCDGMPGRVAALHFDGCINNGVGRAAKFLQKAVGVTPDGAIGKDTLTALSKLSDISVCNSICDQRTLYYHAIVENDPTQQRFIKGWINRIEEMRKFSTNPIGKF
jgi:lysozyme family protein